MQHEGSPPPAPRAQPGREAMHAGSVLELLSAQMLRSTVIAVQHLCMHARDVPSGSVLGSPSPSISEQHTFLLAHPQKEMVPSCKGWLLPAEVCLKTREKAHLFFAPQPQLSCIWGVLWAILKGHIWGWGRSSGRAVHAEVCLLLVLLSALFIQPWMLSVSPAPKEWSFLQQHARQNFPQPS